MKKSIFILLMIVGFSISSCGNKSDDPNSKMDDTTRYRGEENTTSGENNDKVSQDANSEEKAPPTEKPLTENTPEGIRVNFPVGATEVSITGKIDGMKSVTYLLDVTKGQTLIGSIEAVSEAGKEQGNIRFSQIISPSGNADGPFGPSIKYDLTEAGSWKLIVSENQMSGDPWTGEFKMIVGIK